MRGQSHVLWLLLALSSTAVGARTPYNVARHRGAISGATDSVGMSAQRIAATFGIVTSTLRTAAHNRAVGGVPDSYHLLGRALDVARKSGITHAQIAAALRRAGYVLIESLDEGDHSHFAFGAAIRRQTAEAPTNQVVRQRLLADEHGSLVADLGPRPELRAALGAPLHVHIRGKR